MIGMSNLLGLIELKKRKMNDSSWNKHLENKPVDLKRIGSV